MKKKYSFLLCIALVTVNTTHLFSQTNTNAGTNAGNAGGHNTSIGYNANDVVTGGNNTTVGSMAGRLLTTGSANVFLGNYAGEVITTGISNIFIGTSTGSFTNGSHNIFMGTYGGSGTATKNVLIGQSAGNGITNGAENTALGFNSGNWLTTGNYNSYFGAYAGRGSNTGTLNTILGYKSGYNVGSGSGNVFIGNEAGYSEAGSNKLYIDNSSTATPLIFGDFSLNRLGINSLPNSTHTLTVGGTIHASGIYVNGQSITDAGFEFWTKVGTNIWNNTGNVGIGTNFPSNPFGYKLAVNGKIGAHEVQIENNSSTWPDFVFKPDYKLRTLLEIEEFIKANGHLPEIPSEAQVKVEGIKLAEMNAKLLQKIEELTLYVIELKKEVDVLKKKTDDQK